MRLPPGRLFEQRREERMQVFRQGQAASCVGSCRVAFRRLKSVARAVLITRSPARKGTMRATGRPWDVTMKLCPSRTRRSTVENVRLASAAESACDAVGKSSRAFGPLI
jgi:hypothetical protein